MIKPAYKLTIGGQLVDTTDEPQASTVVDLKVQLDMNVATDIFKLKLGNVGHLKPGREDDAKIELGYADAEGGLEQVIAGQVDIVNQGSLEDLITGNSAAAILLNSFTDKTFENKTAGDIVQALASDASVDVDNAEPGIIFPAYVIDSQKSFYHHMKDLAELCGFDAYFNSDNKIVFKKFLSGNIIHIFEHTKHILNLKVETTAPLAGKVEAWGESGTKNGSESWAWLSKDFDALKGSAGTGSPTLLLQESVLRTGQAAATAAEALDTKIKRDQVMGTLLSMGRPQVRLGDAIRLKDLPESELNQIFQVRAVTHRINKTIGFTTEIKFRSIN